MRAKTYIVAVKSEREKKVPRNWVEEIRNISGIKVWDGAFEQVRISADDESLKHLRDKLGANFFIEEEVTRY